MGEFYTKVAGVTFDGRQRYIRQMRVGENIILEREPYNTYDKNAIKVINANGNQIGFIGKELAAQLAPKMDNGMRYTAVCTAITGNNPGDNCGVNIKISEIELFPYQKNLETRIRIKVITSGSQDVFNVIVRVFIANDSEDKEIETYVIPIHNDDITSFEIKLQRRFDYIGVVFEEHQYYQRYRFDIDEEQLGQMFGIYFEEKPPSVFDVPTFAGGYSFNHPEFDIEMIDYNSIIVNTESHQVKYVE